MKLLSPLKIAYRALRAHKVRSALTVLGLLIGVMSVIVVINMGQSVKYYILNQSQAFGSDFVQVEIKVPSTKQTSSENAMGMAQGITITTLKIEDGEKIGQHPNIRGFYAMQMGQDVVSSSLDKKTTMLWGVSAQFFDLYNAEIISGRPFTEEEDKSQAQVVIIGPALKDKLFSDDNALGQSIKIGNLKYTVIGVMEEQGNYLGFMDMDSMVYLPIRTLQKKILGIDHVQAIMAYLKDTNYTSQTAADVVDIMRAEHDITDPKKDDFAVSTMDDVLKMVNTLSAGITFLLVAIAAISLLVGGVGIMNVMYVSVSERTYEIGLRKAVGATSKDILWQFLWEAIFLTFLGGLIGVILGTLFSFTAYLLAKNFGFDWGFNFSFAGLILSVGFSVITGLIFGVYPARHAASLNPVDALRYE
ncbi:FtsX-like permease family protein [Candidatus Kuenenbacteria bacterium]|nr:FtsX-like permease family protein [Candidatus Kuenenbacteria bacterium]